MRAVGSVTSPKRPELSYRVPVHTHCGQHNLTDALHVGIVHLLQKGFAHARVPEVLQVLGNALQRFISIRHALKEEAYLVGHSFQVVVVHRMWSRLNRSGWL